MWRSQVQLLLRLKQHDRAYLRSLLFFFAMPQLGRPSIYDLSWSIHIFPNHPEKHPMTIRFISRRQPQQPRRPRRILGARGETPLHRAALKGHAAVVEQLISAGATVDAADNGGRGLGRVFGSFREWLWQGDGRGSYIGSWFSCFALGCWVVFVRVV